MSEVRLIPMRVAGKYSRGGLKLVPVAETHREAWEAGITEEETLLVLAPWVNPAQPKAKVHNKLRAAFEVDS